MLFSIDIMKYSIDGGAIMKYGIDGGAIMKYGIDGGTWGYIG